MEKNSMSKKSNDSEKKVDLSTKNNVNTKNKKKINHNDIEVAVIELLEQQNKLTELHKKHTKNIKMFLKLYRQERKENKKNLKQSKKVKDPNKVSRPNALTRPTKITDVLCDFLNKPHGSLVSRSDVTKSISKYIKSNKLYVPENKKQFIPDDNLKSILDPLEEKDINKGYTYFNLQRYIKNLFIKSTDNINVVNNTA